MRQLLLVNPPELKGYTNERTYSGGIGVSRKLKPFERDATVLPPIDILYTAAVAEQKGCKVNIVDLLLDRWHGPRAERFVLNHIDPECSRDLWVGIRLSIPSLLLDLDFANRMKELLPGAKVFVFGSVIMTTVNHWIHQCDVDFLIFGEPESVMGDILDAPDYHRVVGVICPKNWVPLRSDELYMGSKNEEQYRGWVKQNKLKELPRPAWHLLPLERYAPGGRLDKLGVYIQASRGCPIGCTMCPYMLLEGKPWRANPIEQVVDEIEYLNKTYGIYKMRFRDPNFGFNRKYARELCEAIIRRDVKLEATVETSVEVFDEDTLRAMRQAGISTITTGIETADAACIESIGQKISVNEKLAQRIKFCHELGFHIYGTFCLGTPEENWDTVRKTWEFAQQLDVESGFTVMTPFPGTPMYWRALSEGLLPKRMRYSDWNSYTATMRTNHLTPRDLDYARLWARLETIIPYRLRRAQAQGRQAVTRTYIHHIPHMMVRSWVRGYVWWRSRFAKHKPETRAVAAPIKAQQP